MAQKGFVAGRGCEGIVISLNFSVSKEIFQKIQNLGLKITTLGEFGATLKFRAPVVSSVESLQLSVRK